MREAARDVSVLDLSARFLRAHVTPPIKSEIKRATELKDFAALDKVYFAWEDELRALCHADGSDGGAGLLSGVSLPRLERLSLRDAVSRIRTGERTVFSRFLTRHVAAWLRDTKPRVVGVTIASQQQVIPAIELLLMIREVVPESFIALGGNVVTRLRNTSAFAELLALVDHITLFQGERAFVRVLGVIERCGAQRARQQVPETDSDERVPLEAWPTPGFRGIDFDDYVGVPTLSYVSTRGCYWGKCHFCAIPAGWATSGYGGSAPPEFVFRQLVEMVKETGIPRVKFVDEAVPPSKVSPLAKLIARSEFPIQWEAYARLESAFEDLGFLEEAYAGGLRKLYFGLEQAPTTNRLVLNKNDRGDPCRILRACRQAGIKVHLFCMVGHPGSSRKDAELTTRFLIDNHELVDTADLVGFRLDRGTTVPGVRPAPDGGPDWAMSTPFVPEHDGILGYEEVQELEVVCQEALWDAVPRLLHPLYRVVGPWTAQAAKTPALAKVPDPDGYPTPA